MGLAVGAWARAWMFLLAELNPDQHGVDTDDGFPMGEFTPSGTVNLLAAATFFGVLGGLLFLAVRGLRFGPTWFRAISIVIGPSVVVGSQLVHTDGVDFTVLEPLWLAVVLTLSMPVLFSVGIVWLGDRWLGDGPTFWQRLPAPAGHAARGALAILTVAAGISLGADVTEILDGSPYF
jgi:hypothetical protein